MTERQTDNMTKTQIDRESARWRRRGQKRDKEGDRQTDKAKWIDRDRQCRPGEGCRYQSLTALCKASPLVASLKGHGTLSHTTGSRLFRPQPTPYVDKSNARQTRVANPGRWPTLRWTYQAIYLYKLYAHSENPLPAPSSKVYKVHEGCRKSMLGVCWLCRLHRQDNEDLLLCQSNISASDDQFGGLDEGFVFRWSTVLLHSCSCSCLTHTPTSFVS